MNFTDTKKLVDVMDAAFGERCTHREHVVNAKFISIYYKHKVIASTQEMLDFVSLCMELGCTAQVKSRHPAYGSADTSINVYVTWG